MDVLALAAHILLPFLFAALIARPKAVFNLRTLFRLDANNGLFDQPLFRFVVLVPVFLFISFGVIAWSGYTIDLSADGLNKFIQISKLPLGLLSLIVPVGAIVASFHSTHQTAVQISLADTKARLDQFYQHRGEFFNYFDRIGERNYEYVFTAKFRALPSVHKRFFGGSPEFGTPTVRLDALNTLQQGFGEVGVKIRSVIEGLAFEPRSDEYADACMLLKDIAFQLGLMEIYQDMDGVLVKSQEYSFRTLGSNVTCLLAALRYSYDFFNALCEFSGAYLSSPEPPLGYLVKGEPPNVPQSNLNISAAISDLRNREFERSIK